MEKKYFKKAISYNGLNRVETSEYPYKAVRECLLNAIVHRNYFGPPIQISIYDDKFMVWNPGQLPEELSIDDLKIKHSSYPRNNLLADVFFKAGLIETWGRGTIKIIEECVAAGLPEPRFEIMSGGISVTFFRDFLTKDYLSKKELNERQIEAVLFVKRKGRITNSEYQELYGVARNTASRDLTDLVNKGVLKSSKIKGAGSFYELSIAP